VVEASIGIVSTKSREGWYGGWMRGLGSRCNSSRSRVGGAAAHKLRGRRRKARG